MALEEARISPMDRGFLFGDGVYEVLAQVDGHLRARDLHAERLKRSLQGIGLEVSVETVFASVDAVLERSALADAKIYVQVTRGPVAVREHTFPQTAKPTVFVTVTPFKTVALTGSRAIVRPDIRWSRNHIKSVSLLGNVLLAEEARQHGAAEAILHRAGEVTEASTSNVFMITDQVLATPPLSDAILPGVTRHLVLDIARDLGFQVSERAISVDELPRADTVFVTSSTRGLLPITELDPGGPVGTGQPLDGFGELQSAYQDRLHRGATA